jgi:hypothetical protein
MARRPAPQHRCGDVRQCDEELDEDTYRVHSAYHLAYEALAELRWAHALMTGLATLPLTSEGLKQYILDDLDDADTTTTKRFEGLTLDEDSTTTLSY